MSPKQEKDISENAVRRLPRYFRYLRELLMNGIMRVSSRELADRLAITPSQVRSDLNRFAGTGQQGYGYNVKLLYTEISRELGAGDNMTAVIVGGELPIAADFTERFESRGVTVSAHFCENPRKDALVPQYRFSEMAEFLQRNPTDMAMLLENTASGENLTEILLQCGIRGVWNMTQTDLSLPIPVINLPIGDIIMHLCYEIRNSEKEEEP